MEMTEEPVNHKPLGDKGDGLGGRKILVASPVFKGDLWTEHVKSLFASSLAAHEVGAQVEVLHIGNTGNIPRLRQWITNYFLAGDYTHLFFIDSDISWSPEDFVRFIGTDHPVVSAPQINRKAHARNPSQFSVWFKDPGEIEVSEDGFMLARRAATNFMIIERGVFYRLQQLHACPRVWDKHDEAWVHRYWFYGVIPDEQDRPVVAGEDWTFCELLQEAGYPGVWVAPDVFLRHRGITTYDGQLSDLMKIKTHSKEEEETQE